MCHLWEVSAKIPLAYVYGHILLLPNNGGQRSSVDEGRALSLETGMMAQLNASKPSILAPTLPWSQSSDLAQFERVE